jgi:hypothetical protein
VVFLELVPTTAGPAGLVVRLHDGALFTGPQTIPLTAEVQLDVEAEFSPPVGTALPSSPTAPSRSPYQARGR